MITYTFLAIIAIFSIYALTDRNIMYKYMFYPYGIKHNREHYRFLTHAFIHGDYIHLAFNFITLFSIGHDLEERIFPHFFGDKLGKLYYILLFTGGIYAASITEYIRQRNNPAYSSLGVSGALSSILFCWIMMVPKHGLSLFIIEMPGWVAGILLLGVSYFLMMRKKNTDYTDNISHESHFWGAMFGILFFFIIKPDAISYFLKQFFS